MCNDNPRGQHRQIGTRVVANGRPEVSEIAAGAGEHTTLVGQWVTFSLFFPTLCGAKSGVCILSLLLGSARRLDCLVG